MNGRTNSSGTTINDLEIPLDPCTNLIAIVGNGQVSLTWTDPKDKYATPEGEAMEDTDQLVSEWSHTVLVRKVGSQPNDVNDGIIVTSSSIKNQYQELGNGYIDINLQSGTEYYYGVFAFNEDGISSIGTFVNIIAKNGTPLSELAEGTIIKINENGSPVEFYLAKHNYESELNGIGRDLLVRKDCAYEGKYDSSYKKYEVSDIRLWFQNTYKIRLSSILQSGISSTTFVVGYNQSVYTHEDPVFCLSATELGANSYAAFNIEGSLLAIADTIRLCNYNDNPSIYWTRSPTNISTATDTAIAILASQTNNINATNPGVYYTHGYRPCFTLPSDVFINFDFSLNEEELEKII